MRQHPASPSERERALGGRPLLLSALLFALGIALAPWLPSLPGVIVALCAACALLAALGSRRVPLICFSLISLSFFLWGVGLAQLRARVEVPRLLEDEEVVEGRVASDPEARDGRTRFILEVARLLRREGVPVDARFGVRLSVEGDPAVFRGDVLRAKVRLRPIDGPQNWGASDPRPGHAARGVLFFGTVVRGQWSAIGHPPVAASFQKAYRDRFAALVGRVVGDGPATAELIQTLGLGDRATLPEETLDDFRAIGLAHLLSVSGLHVGVVALGFYRLLRWLLTRSARLILRIDVLRLASIGALPMAWAYVCLTGAEVPAIRAGVMVSALFAARILDREQDAPSALCLSALLILATDPASLRALSFQLSFVSIAALLVLQPRFRRLFPTMPIARSGWRALISRSANALFSTIAATLAASLATAPLVASAFQQASLMAVAANAAALPIGSALTVLSAAAALAMPLSDHLATAILWIAAPLARGLLALANLLSTPTWASLHVASPTPLFIAAFYGSLLAIPLWERSHRAAACLAIAGLLTCGMSTAWPLVDRRLDRSLRVTFLAIGQGDAALVRFPLGQTMLIDGGGDPEGRWKIGAQVLLPALRRLGIHRVDTLVLSHPHPDHALGLIEVASALAPREVWIGANTANAPLTRALLDASNQAEIHVLAAGDRRSIDGVEIDVLHPPSRDVGLRENDASLLMKLRWGEVSFLFTGDLERTEEALLVEARSDLRATVLKVPHHGSRTSSTPAFVEAISPAHAVFSCGRGNLFGFPNPEVVERYVHQGSAIHRTDREGAITFATDGRTLRVEKPFADEAGARVARRFLRSALDAPMAFEAKARADVSPGTTKGKTP
ncbi:MAG: DNA internalization-related competence protein ComEC/Rec2 [Myxococcales bacterium]|jgi:competence protein ComEC|nr:DNA internalization-related competence protein ComEC/Rec2 [Myxococcales bacterium]